MTATLLDRKGHFLVVSAIGAIVTPVDASAHLVSTGLGPIYDGVAHLTMSPEAILPIIALGILAGLRGPAHARISVLILPVAWLVFGLVGSCFGSIAIHSAFYSLPLLIVGGLAAADVRMPIWCMGLLAAVLGGFEGYGFGSAYSGYRDGLTPLIGSSALIFVSIAFVSAAVLKAKWDWSRIAIRVVGSWTAASGMLLLGWGLR